MRTAGQQQTVRAEDVAVMGITEILWQIPKIYASYRRLVTSLKRSKPDVAVLIDFPDVNFRLAKHLHAAGVPVIWFVSPQLWAWKRSRLRWVQQRVSRMLVIFPFEETFYRNRGVDAQFVGHPLAEAPLPTSTREAYAATHKLDPAKTWIALLPGSRWKEVRANLPALHELAVSDLFSSQADAITFDGSTFELPTTDTTHYEFLLPVASTISRPRLEALITQLEAESLRYFTDTQPSSKLSSRPESAHFADAVERPAFSYPHLTTEPGVQSAPLHGTGGPPHPPKDEPTQPQAAPFMAESHPDMSGPPLRLEDERSPLPAPTRPHLTLVPDAREALHHARASVVASGTATVQAAVIGNPFVVVYRVSALTFALARKLVRYPDEFPSTFHRMRPEDPDPPIAMVNLIAGRRLVPELLQSRFTAQNVAEALTPLLAETPQREAQIAGLAEVRRSLQSPTGIPAIEAVAAVVLETLNPTTNLSS